MGIKRRKQLKFRARQKRRNRRSKLKSAGNNPDQYFYSGIYLGENK